MEATKEKSPELAAQGSQRRTEKITVRSFSQRMNYVNGRGAS
jgi:hypothetical protein